MMVSRKKAATTIMHAKWMARCALKDMKRGMKADGRRAGSASECTRFMIAVVSPSGFARQGSAPRSEEKVSSVVLMRDSSAAHSGHLDA
jgi:hypothetical protein